MIKFWQSKIPPKYSELILLFGTGVVFGAAWFLILYGRFSLGFSHVNWIYAEGGDVLQHQLGWEWFRQEPWSFPLGTIKNYGYPFGTSVALMDSIPLFAIPFKLISPWLGQNFQYLGLWELTSVIGQMLMGLLILKEFARSNLVRVAGASMLVLSPPMIFRAFLHNSLSAQWIILAGVWLILLEYKGRGRKWAWVILFGAAMMIHVYFVPMLLPLWGIALFFRYWGKATKWWVLLFDALAVIGMIFLVGYGTGIFSMSLNNYSSGGFSKYSWNLNGFINPFQGSQFFTEMKTKATGGQFEGFSYLGLGNFLILPIGLFLFFRKEYSRSKLKFIVPFCAVSTALILLSLTNEAFFNAHPLWNFEIPAKLLSLLNIFRSPGRFIWPVFYFLVLFGLVMVIRNFRYAAILLITAVLLQLIDLQPLYAPKNMPGYVDYQPKMQSELWQLAAASTNAIVIYPANDISTFSEPISLFAVHNHLTLNTGYFARANFAAITKYADREWDHVIKHEPDAQTIYILSKPNLKTFARKNLADTMIICDLDGYTVLFSPDNKLAASNVDLTPSCSIPPIKIAYSK